MIILSNKTEKNLSKEAFDDYSTSYNAICIDMGTGDGKRLYRIAKKNPDILYIGIDPAKNNLLEISSKICKKPQKGGLDNILFVIAAVENPPVELQGIADNITVFFPWGSLLETIVKPLEGSMLNLHGLAKSNATFTFVTTYSDFYENNEIEKRNLPDINLNYFNGEYSQRLKELGFITTNIEELNNESAREIGSKWAKILSSGRKRIYYRIDGFIQ